MHTYSILSPMQRGSRDEWQDPLLIHVSRVSYLPRQFRLIILDSLRKQSNGKKSESFFMPYVPGGWLSTNAQTSPISRSTDFDKSFESAICKSMFCPENPKAWCGESLFSPHPLVMRQAVCDHHVIWDIAQFSLDVSLSPNTRIDATEEKNSRPTVLFLIFNQRWLPATSSTSIRSVAELAELIQYDAVHWKLLRYIDPSCSWVVQISPILQNGRDTMAYWCVPMCCLGYSRSFASDHHYAQR